jgi:hypothetical protein
VCRKNETRLKQNYFKSESSNSLIHDTNSKTGVDNSRVQLKMHSNCNDTTQDFRHVGAYTKTAAYDSESLHPTGRLTSSFQTDLSYDEEITQYDDINATYYYPVYLRIIFGLIAIPLGAMSLIFLGIALIIAGCDNPNVSGNVCNRNALFSLLIAVIILRIVIGLLQVALRGVSPKFCRRGHRTIGNFICCCCCNC